jgi:Cytochrome P450
MLLDCHRACTSLLYKYVRALAPCRSKIGARDAGPRGEQVANLMVGPLDFLRSVRARHGGCATFVLGGERVILVSDPTAVQQIVVDDAHIWIKEGTAFFPGSSLAGNGLLVSDGDTWRRQRRMTNPAFRQKAVRVHSYPVAWLLHHFSLSLPHHWHLDCMGPPPHDARELP